MSPSKPEETAAASDRQPDQEGRWELRLYVAGQTPKCVKAFANLRRICEEHIAGRYELQIIDIYQQPALAQDAQIIAAPTLVKTLPLPLRQIIGDMSDDGRVLVAMGIKLPENPELPAKPSRTNSR